ncbi:hypothetical protein ATE47_16950 [Chryseobacterium sp. IHB B 17019]|uniref:hypothetical protein n=1 Tax=Chryseobacterium sp. IHB B 17019 TaxID=1721091 RepID=UPI000722737B|nr:hypothetical protein [Chryseobacterium sp. IHB B 17019]ALR32100.1 hypothetical protein ATE47_16950 [Chryseobacterium sp. IHB B 17019]
MKKYLLSFALAFMSLMAFAQSDYEKAMKENIAKVETAQTAEEFTTLANNFHRIAGKDENNWLPFYYAGLANIQKGRALMREGKMQDLDFIAGQAQKYIDAASHVAPTDNAEIHLLNKMAASLRMMVNPQQRYMTDGAKAAEEMKKAEKLDPNNPRVALIKAEDTYFTPEQYGGSKTKGMEQFKDALAKFNSYTPKSALEPNWGKSEAEYFVSGAKK